MMDTTVDELIRVVDDDDDGDGGRGWCGGSGEANDLVRKSTFLLPVGETTESTTNHGETN
jgi:hypothetical protein